MREALEAVCCPPGKPVGGGLLLNGDRGRERERGRTMKKWEVTFFGDDWKLVVSLEYKADDLGGLIEEAKRKAGAGECGIKLEGYYEVQEKEVA
jgi:hypothetical protein